MLCTLESNIQMLMGCDLLQGQGCFSFVPVFPAPISVPGM